MRINEQGLRDFERQVKKDLAAHLQQMIDGLALQYRGRPVPEVKQALRRTWEADGGRFDDDAELTEWATAISEGAPIRIR